MNGNYTPQSNDDRETKIIKVPILKIALFLLVGYIVINVAAGMISEIVSPTPINDEVSVVETNESNTSTQTEDAKPIEEKTPLNVEPVQEPTSEDEPLSFELVAGEAGDYGKPYTVNSNTEFEENYIVYVVPAGTYTVTNTGEYMGQFNVYSEKLAVNDAGWQEPAEVFYMKLLDVGASDTVTIGEGQIIEIHEPDKFTLTAE